MVKLAPLLIFFCGLLVGVPLGMTILGVLQMVREEREKNAPL